MTLDDINTSLDEAALYNETTEALRAVVAEAEARLDRAQSALWAHHKSTRSRSRKREEQNLREMKQLAEAGAQVMDVQQWRSTIIPGVVTKVTAARVTCLTQAGVLVFDRKPRAYTEAGAGRGDARSYRLLDVANIKDPS